MTGGDVVRVLVVDDHLVFAEALADCLAEDPRLVVVAVVSTAAEAESLVASTPVDVALVDVGLGGEDGLHLVTLICDRHPHVRVVVVTCHDDQATAVAAVRAGAAGFVSKAASTATVLDAVIGVSWGETWVPPRLLTAVLAELKEARRGGGGLDEALAALTAREREVLGCMVRGLDRPAIARELLLSTNTVRTHVKSLFAKLDVHSSIEAVAVATRAGIRAAAVRSEGTAPER